MQEIHYSDEEILDYLDGAATLDREIEVETHLAECDSCTVRARQLRRQTLVLKDITARNHARALELELPLVVATAVQAATSKEANKRWGSQLRDWSERSLGRVQGLLRIVVHEGSATLQVAAASAELLAQGGWQFQPATRAREEADHLQVVGIPEVRVLVRGQKIMVSIPARLLTGPEPPLLLLIPLDAPAEAEAHSLERRNDEFATELDVPPSGRFLLVWKPFL